MPTITPVGSLSYDSDLLCDFLNNGSYTSVGKVKDIKGPKKKRKSVNVSHLKSPSHTDQKRPGFKDPGQVEFDLIHEPSTVAALDALYEAGSIVPWKILESNGSYWSGSGFVCDLSEEHKLEDEIMNPITIEFTGPLVFTEV